VVRRLVLAVAGASLAYFVAALALDPRAALSAGSPRPPRAVVSARLASLGLDDRTPLAWRYAHWAAGVAHGDFGRTLDGTPVRGELLHRSEVSLRLAVAGGVPGWLGGLLLGSTRARTARLLVAGVLATPVFTLALLAQTAAQTLNTGVGSHLFAWTGEMTPGAPWPVADRLRHLLLPATVLALAQAAMYARYQRGLLREAVDAGHVRAAMARGLRRRTALRRHAFRLTLPPMTAYAAYGFAALLTGTAITEKTFAWHGLGEWLIDAIASGDVNTTAACGCVAALSIAAVGLATDLLHAALDPRACPKSGLRPFRVAALTIVTAGLAADTTRDAGSGR
jgi:ABC-type dipeptide/oligopeptide/nickel transport system permease component